MTPLVRAADGLSDVIPGWVGQTVTLLGGGPSLTFKQVLMVKAAYEVGKTRVIAINNAYLVAPFADICFFVDSKWWEWHRNGIDIPSMWLSAEQVRKKFAKFPGQKCTRQGSGDNVKDPSVHILRRKYLNGLNNSGLAALSLAKLTGATTAILLGYDGRLDDETGHTHWFEDHPKATDLQEIEIHRDSFYPMMDITVINCSPGTAIEAYPYQCLNEALNG